MDWVPIIVSALTGLTTVAVAALSSRKTKTDAHEELATAESALKRELTVVAELLANCESRHASMFEEVQKQRGLIKSMQRNIDNLRDGKPTDWAPLNSP